MKLGLVVLAAVVLVPYLSEGRTVSKCELKAAVEKAIGKWPKWSRWHFWRTWYQRLKVGKGEVNAVNTCVYEWTCAGVSMYS